MKAQKREEARVKAAAARQAKRNTQTNSMKLRKREEGRAKAAATRKAKAANQTESFKERKKEAARAKAAATRQAKRNAFRAQELQGLKPAENARMDRLPLQGEERRKAMLKRFQLNTATRRRLQKKNPYVMTNDWAV